MYIMKYILLSNIRRTIYEGSINIDYYKMGKYEIKVGLRGTKKDIVRKETYLYTISEFLLNLSYSMKKNVWQILNKD